MPCRYEFSHVKAHFICVACRLGFKSVTKCPKCHRSMQNMGFDFKIPPKNNVRQWRKVALLLTIGERFSSGCGCGGPGIAPRTLLDAKHHIEATQIEITKPWANKRKWRARMKMLSRSRRSFRESRHKLYEQIPNRPL